MLGIHTEDAGNVFMPYGTMAVIYAILMCFCGLDIVREENECC